MEIEYKNRPLKKVCENASEAKKKYGPKMAELIHKRIDQLRAAESVEFMIKYRIGRCHGLTGDRKKQFALDLLQPYRLIFEKKDSHVKLVKIIEIENYH